MESRRELELSLVKKLLRQAGCNKVRNVFAPHVRPIVDHPASGFLKRKDAKPYGRKTVAEEKETNFTAVFVTFLDALMKQELKDAVEQDAEVERLDDLLTLFKYFTFTTRNLSGAPRPR